MSFFTVVKQDATDIENAVVAGLKTGLNYVDNVVVTDVIPALETELLNAIEKLGQEAVAELLGNAASPVAIATSTSAS